VVFGALALFGAGLLLASCGGDEEEAVTTTSPTDSQTVTATSQTTETSTQPEGPTIVRVAVAGGIPEGGIVRETVDKGDKVVLVVTSDVADEIHVHGYDVSRDVVAGGTARVAFDATIPGRFEVELESRGAQIAEITVNP
jgi:hypothetical protein